MARDYLRSLLLAELCGFWAFSATAATSLFSNYGQIQNVQNYSTNPFWSPNSPYNQRLPQPVYAQGADLNAGDCISVVQSMVSAQCMSRNNCKNTNLSEIRPTIMVQLANLPGHNYVSACSGYLDNVFETYKTQNKSGVSNRSVSFPGATTPNPDANASDGIQLKNPYKQQPTKWQIGIKSRADELQELQNENGANDYGLSAQKFPATYEDLSFTKRWENEREGIMPYKDLKPYEVPDIKNIAEWCAKGSEHHGSIACAKYRDCTNLLQPNDANIVRAEYDDNHQNCHVVQCKSGFVPEPNVKVPTRCINAPGTDCLDEIDDDNASQAEYNENGRCEVVACVQGWHVNDAKTGCDEDLISTPETGDYPDDPVADDPEDQTPPTEDGYYWFQTYHDNGEVRGGLDYDDRCYVACWVDPSGDSDISNKIFKQAGLDAGCAMGEGTVCKASSYITGRSYCGENLKANEEQVRKVISLAQNPSIKDEGRCDYNPDVHLRIMYHDNTTGHDSQSYDLIIDD